MPAAAAFAWFLTNHDLKRVSAVRRGLLASIPATAVASWSFRQSTLPALTEAVLAYAAVVIAVACVVSLRRAALVTPRPAQLHPDWRVTVGLIAAVCVIVTRQTMEIGSVLITAVFELRSLDAVSTLLAGAAIAGFVAWLWAVAGARLPLPSALSATRAIAAVFLAQALLYAFHESAEARLLPWSDILHTATEPYGPDGIYGVHVSDVLVLAPFLTSAIALVRGREWPSRWWSAAQRRRLGAVTLVLAALVLSGMQRDDSRPLHAAASAGSAAITPLLKKPHVLFRSTERGPNFGRMSLAALDGTGTRLTLALSCDRVSFAGGHGICLHTERGVFNLYSAVLVDGALNGGATVGLQGLPSRTRISADGRVGAITVFVLGDGYTSSFSTRTTIVDMSSGDVIGELEQFATWRNGARFRAADFNFWGVTFAHDANTFYASLRTAGTTYLVRGELALRKLTVLGENAECPSLSPDDRFIAYKKRVGPSPDAWRLHVLELSTGKERIIGSEVRYIDDQVEWLDAHQVLYAVPRRTTSISDVWVASMDGGSPPRIFLSEAESPAVVR